MNTAAPRGVTRVLTVSAIAVAVLAAVSILAGLSLLVKRLADRDR